MLVNKPIIAVACHGVLHGLVHFKVVGQQLLPHSLVLGRIVTILLDYHHIDVYCQKIKGLKDFKLCGNLFAAHFETESTALNATVELDLHSPKCLQQLLHNTKPYQRLETRWHA